MQPEPNIESKGFGPETGLIQADCLAVLGRNGRLLTPTIERIRAIKATVASWEPETDD